MKTRIAILTAFVVALAIVGALYATNRTAEAESVRRIEVQGGQSFEINISTESSTCNAAAHSNATFRRVDLSRGLTYTDGRLSVPTYPTYPRRVWFGYIVYGSDANGGRVCRDYDLVRVTVTAPPSEFPPEAPNRPKNFIRDEDVRPPVYRFSWTAPDGRGAPVLDYQVQADSSGGRLDHGCLDQGLHPERDVRRVRGLCGHNL